MESRFDGGNFFNQIFATEADVVREFLTHSNNYQELVKIKHVSDSKRKAFEDSVNTVRTTYEDGTTRSILTEQTMQSVFIDNYYRISKEIVERINKLTAAQTFAELLETLSLASDARENLYVEKAIGVAGCFFQKANAAYYMIKLDHEIREFVVAHRYSIDAKPTISNYSPNI